MTQFSAAAGDISARCRGTAGLVAAAYMKCGLQALTLVLALSVSALADDDVNSKLSYCQDCHGPSGQGYHGYYPIPRLAGQKPEYIKNQLQAFIEHRRTNNIMFNVAHSLRPSMVDALADRFARLNPRPLDGGRRRSVEAGRKIFENGMPEANIAACAACHGPEAQGNGQIPRLAGQLADYLTSKLTNWSQERGRLYAKPDTSLIMEPVAHSLTRAQVEAVAAYVSRLR